MTDGWVCVFDGRAGGHARAVFATSAAAQQFAERHARAVPPGGLPLKWDDTGAALVLTTMLGVYRVARTGAAEPPAWRRSG